jgi:hypothetical protein
VQNNEATREATCERTRDAHDDRHQGAMLGVSGISRRGVAAPRLGPAIVRGGPWTTRGQGRCRSVREGVDGCGCSEVCFPDVCCVAHRVSLIVPPRKAHIGLLAYVPVSSDEDAGRMQRDRPPAAPDPAVRSASASISARPPCGALWWRAPINTIGRVLRRPRRPCEVSGRGDFPVRRRAQSSTRSAMAESREAGWVRRQV